MTTAPAHRWLVTADGTRAAAAPGPDAPALLPTVSAHRRLRGPYTAAGTILRAVVPQALERFPDLVEAHLIELLSAAPELRNSVPAPEGTLTSLAIPKERTRFYSRLRTQRIAHGITDFLRDLMLRQPSGPATLVIERAEEADATDAEFTAILLRRMPAELLAVTVVTAAGATPQPGLVTALERYATRTDLPPAPPAPAEETANPFDAARRWVDSECLATDPAGRAAYRALDAADRAALHDARAEALENGGQGSRRLGAIPFHREHGADPSGAGVEALYLASDWCIALGFYDITIELARRGIALTPEGEEQDFGSGPVPRWWPLTTKVTMSLSALDRAEEALAVYDATRARTTSPRVHMHAAYATAMLYTRHLPPERRDHRMALGWANIAIAFAAGIDESEDRAFSTVFQQNGRALVEGHLGNAEEALALVTDGIARLDAELGENDHALHRSVLRHNRALVLKGLGRLQEAREDYETVIALDPNYAEYHFEYAGLLRGLGEEERALAEYDVAARLTPPFVELFYNRGDLRAVRGDVAGALADFDYVLELDPEYVDAYVNRAALLLREGDLDGAARDVEAGLRLRPGDPHLRSQRARVAWERGALREAIEVLDGVLRDAPDMAEAWALRAAVRFDDADPAGALADLTASLDREESAAVRFNRGAVHEELGRFAEAAEDFGLAIGQDPGDPDGWLRHAVCAARLGDHATARADLAHCAALAPDRAAQATAEVEEALAGDAVRGGAVAGGAAVDGAVVDGAVAGGAVAAR
ncbi:tetratricopeptide repeat protein [Streptantibioticus silvisoli]|uniref:Tetratricopeptide repeat protein n=1 Tax=Streptantibioticus silvisoli TaxID=2705255 RepID=A0ABT6VSU4_9ACTN|nr:tetratricopeptide repeat protein [Streptantibioticus silvisoli]MDI5961543.1 tetratricopeptide repeat protein [Streptantibioticus silvisoli]